MDKKMKITVIGIGVTLVIILIAVISFVVKMLTPSKDVMPLDEYYAMEQDQVLIFLNTDIYEKKGLLIDGYVYVDLDTVNTQFNHRFYWNKEANLLLNTTPNEILKAEINKTEYAIIKNVVESKVKFDCPIVKAFKDEVYVSLDFVKKYSNLSYEYYKEPNRIVVETAFLDYLVTAVSKKTQLRVDASIKSEILKGLKVGDHLTLVDVEDAPVKGFIKVITQDGIIGYVKEKDTKPTYYEAVTSNFVEPVYTSIQKSYTINMVWHQVFNLDAYKNLEKLIKATKGVTTISPTWFKVCDNEGNLASLASKEYVEKANTLGLEVWALVDDFTYSDINMYKVLSNIESRENLENQIMEAVQEYKLNGINIDFEKITKDSAPHYIQFLRELSVKCRNNGIVLSVDNYVPSAYTAFYNRKEQGQIIDYMVVMAYDEHYAGSDVVGSVSSLEFVKAAVKNTVDVVPAEKVIMAIPFYTRLWKTDKDGTITSEAYGMSEGLNVLKEKHVEMEWNGSVSQYYGSYEEDGAKYEIWLEEDESVEEKLKAIFEYEVAGIAGWKLGLEKESAWNVISRYIY